MEKHKTLLKLHKEYLELFDWDNMYHAFFDPQNKTNLDKKIDHLERCVKEKRVFTSIMGYNKLMDNYPHDIENAGGQWDL